MASSLQKLELISFNNLDYLTELGNYTSSWPALDTLDKFKPRYTHYYWADLDYRKRLRRERLLQAREDPFSQLSPDDIKIKYKFYPHTIMDIIKLVGDDFNKTTKRNNPFTTKQCVCLALYVLGHGKYELSHLKTLTPILCHFAFDKV